MTQGGQFLSTVLMTRSVYLTDVIRANIVMAHADLTWTILAPVLIGVLFVVTRVNIQRHRRICADR
jgi:hypothetical protein